ncbi:hypothetical protein OQA88_687 [Cercophora sp. LCS_1]
MASDTLPDLTLYRIDGACSLVAHMALHELAIPFTAVRMVVDPATHKAEAADGSFSGDDYRREINPSGQVPALKVEYESDPSVEPVVITETPAILMYVADLGVISSKGTKYLAGKTPLERAQVASWLAFLSGPLHGQAFGPLSFPQRFLEGIGSRYADAAEKAVMAAGKKKVDLLYQRIEDRLPVVDADKGEEGWAVGGKLSVVDFNLYLFYVWGMKMGIKMGELYPKWVALAKRLECRGPVKTVVWLERIGAVW